MKRNETKKEEQQNQPEQKKPAPIIRVQSGLRAGAMAELDPCC
jgi:hypothetical protein